MDDMTKDYLNIVIDAVEVIKKLASKGMPGYYVSSPFKPVEAFSLKFQEGMYFIKTVKADLPVMKLSDEEKEELGKAIDEAGQALIQWEIQRILTEAMQQLKAGIDTIYKK